MRRRVTQVLLCGSALSASVAMMAGTAGATGAATPTCSVTLGINVHGQHVVGDYVAGSGHADLGWPTPGVVVGKTVAANGGAAIPGGPGPGFHFPNGFAPGASFCTGSKSPGTHL
jgi:hypothetical protein